MNPRVPDSLLDQWIVEALESWAHGEDVGYIYLFREVSSSHHDEESLSLTLSRVTHACQRLMKNNKIHKSQIRGHVYSNSEHERRMNYLVVMNSRRQEAIEHIKNRMDEDGIAV
jgi:hypothetical protein